MTASAEKLSKWLASESGVKEPVHIAQETEDDLLEDLRRGLKQVRAKNR